MVATPELIAELAMLDEAGFPVAPGEDITAYRERQANYHKALEALENELAENDKVSLFDFVKVSHADRIPSEIIAESADITMPLYGFAVRDFPGFFLSESIGLLWGGCLIYDREIPPAIFLIRSSFRNKKRFFIYRREELLAHELCHSFRQELMDTELEEFFAYRTSPSKLRRYMGNCFIRERDALIFVIPSMLLLAAQLIQTFWLPGFPAWLFWIPALAAPAWLMLKNTMSRRKYFRAEKKLKSFGVANPLPILFRMTAAERLEAGNLQTQEDFDAFIQKKSRELRWQVIIHRFMEQKNETL